MALTTDRQKTAHLLRRFGLGASEAELDYYLEGGGGIHGAIDKLLNYEEVDEGFDINPDEFQNAKGKVQIQGVAAWWTTRLLQTRRPLQEKMTLFWHDHFATSAQKVPGGGMMYQQNVIFRRNATGDFHTLLLEVSKDPAMILWLDNQTNLKGKPNENFAREVMELFTLGIGNYTEHDIQQGARAFTGWSLQRKRTDDALGGADFVFRERLHDDGDKEFFGKTGPFNGDDILAILCANPRMSEYITWKMWRFFGYDKPEPALVTRLATEFRNSNLSIKALIRAMATSPEFYSAECERKLYKNPPDFAVATARQLGIGELLLAQRRASGNQKVRGGPVQSVYAAMKNMGMQLLYPPDVSGWAGGSEWISTATMVERIGWSDVIFGTGKSGKGSLNYDAFGLFAMDPTPQGVALKLVSIFDAPLPDSKVRQLATAAWKICGDHVTEQNANATAAAVSRLLFATPEFQFA